MPYTTSREGLRLFYADRGAGPAVLWLQGLGGDHAAWSAQLSAFSPAFRCLAPDTRDVGLSDRANQPYSTADLADDAAHVLNAAGVPRAHVVGLSLGGAVAQELAIRHPERVDRLALVATFARHSDAVRAHTRHWVERYATLGPLEFQREAMQDLFSPEYLAREAHVSALLRWAAGREHPQEPEAFARQAHASMTHDAHTRLGAIRAPTLVVVGSLDRAAPPALSEELAAAIPGARLEWIEGAGHIVNIEAREPFHRTLRHFLAAE